jgi:hypothetical protein
MQRMTGGAQTEGFSGCIHELKIQESGPINFAKKSLRGVGVDECTSGG